MDSLRGRAAKFIPILRTEYRQGIYINLIIASILDLLARLGAILCRELFRVSEGVPAMVIRSGHCGTTKLPNGKPEPGL